MSNAEIKRLYDSTQNITLEQLARITGLSTQELFFILACTDA
jgi:hypothetical protein